MNIEQQKSSNNVDEFSLINTYFKPLSKIDEFTQLGIGDDAAIVSCPPQQQMVIASDMLVSGVHFLSDWDPSLIAYKALAVNISDMAAMGATPKWLSLSLALPEIDHAWLKSFSHGMSLLIDEYDLSLIGGDTTKGPLTISITIHGLLAQGCGLKRSGARVGDKLFVSGDLGAPSLAVDNLSDNQLSANDFEHVFGRLTKPQPQVKLGQKLLAYASSAIDISDGLSADLNHICQASGVGAQINLAALPINSVVKRVLADKSQEYVLASGDEYQLCFSVPQNKLQSFRECVLDEALDVTEIGIITQKRELVAVKQNNNKTQISPQGYKHF